MTKVLRVCLALLLGASSCGVDARPPTFVERPGAIPDLRPIYDALQGSLISVAVPLDLTGDGKLDLAITFSVLEPGRPGSFEPCRERLVLLVQGADGNFTDQTSTLLDGQATLGACMSWYHVADFNGDGRSDLAWAASQEDGRDSSNSNWMNAQSVVLLSNVGGQYTLERIGSPNWWHTVGRVTDTAGRPLIAIGGYTGPSEVWRRDPAGWTQVSVGGQPGQPYPKLDAGGFVFLSDASDAGPSDTLIQQAPYPIGMASMDGMRRTGSDWTPATRLNVFEYLGTVRLVQYSGTVCPDCPVHRVDGRDTAIGSFEGGCSFRFSPSASPMAVLKLSSAYIPGGWTGPEQTVHQGDLIQSTRLFGFRVENGSVVRVPLPIEGEVHHGVNARYIRCTDVNGDALMDLVVFRFVDPNPLVYLNTGSGALRRADDTFPAHLDDWHLAAASMLADFNADGVPDLLRYPGNGRSSQFNNTVHYRYFVGTAPMTANDLFADGFEGPSP